MVSHRHWHGNEDEFAQVFSVEISSSPSPANSRCTSATMPRSENLARQTSRDQLPPGGGDPSC
jgi:hypothetical protein